MANDKAAEGKSANDKAAEGKAAKLVAKTVFHDGSKAKVGGQDLDYQVGEEYQGDDKDAQALRKKGLLCTPDELQASKSALNQRDKKIHELEDKVEDLNKKLSQAEDGAQKLAVENKDLKEALAKAKKS